MGVQSGEWKTVVPAILSLHVKFRYVCCVLGTRYSVLRIYCVKGDANVKGDGSVIVIVNAHVNITIDITINTNTNTNININLLTHSLTSSAVFDLSVLNT